tara:strand:- start:395 stop:706 length:312 start_codon:yes stop_codon:yes gene_type:complete
MHPDRIVNTATVALVSIKALFWLITGVSISGSGIINTLIFVFIFHMGMATVADAMTGQKTIRSLSSNGSIQKISREDPFWYFLYLAVGFFSVFLGILFVLITW